MPIFLTPPRRAALASACLLALQPLGHALAADADSSASTVVVTGARAGAPLAKLPATVEFVTAAQIDESINTVTSAGALQDLPSVHVRERYIGDRNGILVMRVNSSVASAQTTVYADGLLLSNFLNNSFATAPRWGLVSPEEIERVDVIYGPFSALYPGNSAGGVVRITTRQPRRFEAHLRLDAFSQRFREYGTDASFNGHHASASLGQAWGPFSAWLGLDHLRSQSQPQTFGNATAKAGAPAAAGTFTVVDASAVYRDIDTAGRPRIIVSSTGIDHTVQDMVKLKLGWQPTPDLRASYTLGLWQNRSEGTVDSDLRDASGRTVHNAGAAFANPLKFVRIDGQDYTVSNATPSRSRSEHHMHGLQLSARTGAVDWELVASLYDQVTDLTRSPLPRSGFDSSLEAVRPGGQLTDAAGTGWHNLDLRGQWRSGPVGAAGTHTLSFGAHHDRYTLQSVTTGTTAAPIADWLTSSTGALNTSSAGKTQTRALYLQDEWQLAPAWTLTAGARLERWLAFGGSNFNAANTAPNPQRLVYADRSVQNTSPKLALAWQAQPGWLLRAAYGRGVRYPTVAEMFQTFNGPGNIRTNDPNLLPETVNSTEWVVQHQWPQGELRASLFHEDKRNALISQTDVTVTPNISSIQNVDKVRTQGLELAWQLGDVADAIGWRGLSLQGSVTYADSKILRNRRNPGLEGTDQPRIPDWRATAVATWRATDATSASLSYRFSGRQHNALFNTATGQYNDPNPNVYGAVSRYSVFDVKLSHRFNRAWSGSLGINNLGDFKYYVNPNPYPQRTVFASLRHDL
jgi:iron complex outermembrane receptor protein